MDVCLLADHPGLVTTLGPWHHAQWRHLFPDWTLEETLAELRDHASRRTKPTTLVAIEAGELLGSVSLLDEDAPEFKDRGDAWLASLYVVPEARGRGLGRLLVQALVAFAAEQRVERLWLFTPEHATFYARLGWRPQGSATLHGVPVHLMDILPA
jgi:predicted N-acetyltransferase YhbS